MFGPRPEQCIGPECSSSFTALLELPPNQAVELLLHTPEDFETPPPENSCSKEVKKEDGVYSDCKMSLSPEISHTNKRKGRDKKAKETNKKNKKNTKETCEDEKLPYVHVRARRGQATDSHSIAERARREKINARMKLLQELVPGCNKISGTAYVLDEIINHVQSLQHHVEFLSMRLAAVSPGIDINTDTFMTAENGSLVGSNHPGITTPVLWPEEQIRPQYQQLWQLDGFQQPVWVKEEDKSNFVAPETSLLNYDSLGNSDLQKNCLKMQF